jgi:hypothetical protein
VYYGLTKEDFMQRHLYFVFVLLIFCDLAVAQLGFEPPPPPTPKLIQAGRVLDVRKGSYLVNQGILTALPWSSRDEHDSR